MNPDKIAAVLTLITCIMPIIIRLVNMDIASLKVEINEIIEQERHIKDCTTIINNRKLDTIIKACSYCGRKNNYNKSCEGCGAPCK